MWLVHRWGARGIALVYCGIVALFVGSMFSPALWPILSADAAARAIAGVNVSMVAWIVAWVGSMTVATSRNQDLFALTPITMRQYLRHNAWLNWPLLVLISLGPPITIAYFWRATDFLDPIASPLAFANTLLLCAVVMLAPLAEELAGSVRWSRWMVLLRHAFVLLPGWSTLAVLLWIVDYWLLDGVLYGLVREATERALQAGDLPYLALAVLSPFSAVAIQDAVASQAAALLFGAVLGTVLVWEVRAIAGAYVRPQQEWDAARLEEWTEARTEALREDEAQDDEDDAEFGELLALRPSYAADTSEKPEVASSFLYDAAQSPEDTALRCEIEEANRAYRPKGTQRATMGEFALQHPWMVFLVFMALVWMVTQAFTPGAAKIGYAVLGMSAYAHILGGKFGSSARIGLSLPVRLPRLMYRAFLRAPIYRSLCDLLAAALVTVALGASWMVMPVLFLTLRLWAFTCCLRTWLEIFVHSHRKWPSYLWHTAMVVAAMALLAVIAGISDEGTLNLQGVTMWVGLLGLTAVAALSAAGLIAWVHRHDDASLPILRTSYDAPDAFDAED